MKTSLYPDRNCEFCDRHPEQTCDSCMAAVNRGEILRLAQELWELMRGTGDIRICIDGLMEEERFFNEGSEAISSLNILQDKYALLLQVSDEIVALVSHVLNVDIQREWHDARQERGK